MIKNLLKLFKKNGNYSTLKISLFIFGVAVASQFLFFPADAQLSLQSLWKLQSGIIQPNNASWPVSIGDLTIGSISEGDMTVSNNLTVTGTSTLATTTASMINNIVYIEGVIYSQDSTGIQLAIDQSATGTVFILPSATYDITANITRIKDGMKFIGMGATSTIFKMNASFSNAYMIDVLRKDASNIEIAHIGFDAGNSTDDAFIRFDRSSDIEIHHNHFYNVTTPDAIWGLKIGQSTITNVDSESSYNIRIHNNYFYNNDFGTQEAIIATQIKHSKIQNNYFENNTNANAYTLLCYAYCENVEISGNHFKDENGHSMAIMQSSHMDVHNNFIEHNDNFRGIVVINTVNSSFYENHGTSTAITTPFFMLFDRDTGPDGNPNRYPTSTGLTFTKNTISGFRFGIDARTSGVSYKMDWDDITFSDNDMYDIGSAPIMFGSTDTEGINNLFIENNRIHSWSGTSVGAIHISGSSTDITLLDNVFIKNNYISPSAGGSSSGAIRVLGATVENISGNYLVGTGQGYSDISFANNGIANQIYNNTHSDNDLYVGKNIAGTKVFSVDNVGATLFQPSTDSATAFQVKDADGGTAVLNIDTASERVGIGTNSPSVPLHVLGGQVWVDGSADSRGVGLYSGSSQVASIYRQSTPVALSTIFTARTDMALAAGMTTPADAESEYDLVIQSDGNIRIASTTPTTYDFVVGNSAMNSGDTTFTNTSHSSFKENITPFVFPSDYLSRFFDVKVKNFKYKDDYAAENNLDTKMRVGLMADEVNPLVGYSEERTTLSGDDKMNAMWEAIRQVIAKIFGLEEKDKQHDQQIQDLQKRIELLEKEVQELKELLTVCKL